MGNKELIRAREEEIKRWQKEDKWLANKAKDRNEFPEVREQATALRVLLVKPKIDILLLSNQCARIDDSAHALKRVPKAGEWLAKKSFGNQPQEFEASIEALETGIAAAKPEIIRAKDVLTLPQDHFLRLHSFGSRPDGEIDNDKAEVSEAISDSDDTLPRSKRGRKRKYHELGRLVRRLCAYQRKRKLPNAELIEKIQAAIENYPDKDTTGLQPPKDRNFGKHHRTWREAYSCTERHDGYAIPCRKQINSFIAKLKSEKS